MVFAEGQHTMTLDQSALLEVLDASKAAEVDDRIRQAAETIYQALIKTELGAGRDHRLAGRAHRLSLATPASGASWAACMLPRT